MSTHERALAEVIMKGKQRGLALVLSLLMIIVLSILGIAVMRTAVIETRISNFYREQKDAVYAAEGGLNIVRGDYSKVNSVYLSLPSIAPGSVVNDSSNPYDVDPSNPGLRKAYLKYTYYGDWLPKRGSGESAKAQTGKQRVIARSFRVESEGRMEMSGSVLAERRLQVVVEQKVGSP